MTTWRHPLNLFLIKCAVLFIGWLALYTFYIHPNGTLDRFAVDLLIREGTWVLDAIGYDTIQEDLEGDVRTLGIDGSFGVWVGDPCNGVEVIALFIGFLIAFPAKKKHLWWFIPTGVIAIHHLNLLRVIVLAIIQSKAPEYLDFNHTYTFTILIYGFVAALWYIWITYLGQSRELLKAQPQ